MKTKKQENKEINLIRNIFNKCKYTCQGLSYCIKNESSFVLEAICACLIIIMGIAFDISFLDWVIAFGSLCLISIVELINTAIEATVDMFTQEYNEYAKIAKECGSAATGIMTVLAIIVNLIIFVPHFIKLFVTIF